MTSGKSVLVQLGELTCSRFIALGPTSQGSKECDMLISKIKKEFSSWIHPNSQLILQLRHKLDKWKGMYTDFFGQEIKDKSALKVMIVQSALVIK